MLLIDNLTQADLALSRVIGRVNIDRSDPIAAPYRDITRRLQGIPRYILDDNAIHAAVELTLGRPKVLVEALAHCRVPYPALWVEWREGARAKLHDNLRKFGIEEVPGRPMPDRLGFLIESTTGGRAGRITWAWATGDLPPNIAAIDAYFDLDGHFEQPPGIQESFNTNNLMRQWADNPVQLAAINQLWTTAEHRPSTLGMNWLIAGARGSRERFDYLLGGSIADVYGEYITAWAVMLLLTADRKPVSYRPVDRAKLNKARAKKGEHPLLDHTEVVLRISPKAPSTPIPHAPLEHGRKSPRLHIVSRYLAHRNGKYWLVEPHLRGKGERLTRYVHVKG